MRSLIVLLASATLMSGAPHVVTQKGKVFSVTELTVRAGDNVVFKNEDDVVHNVFSSSTGYSFNLKTQPPGVASETSFGKQGDVQVRCAFHPTMKLTVHVR
jgi:plastocyanin